MRYGYWSNDKPSAVLANIDVPINFMFGDQDTLCPRAAQQRFINQIPTVGQQVDFKDADHFFFSGANDAEFKTELDKLLTISG